VNRYIGTFTVGTQLIESYNTRTSLTQNVEKKSTEHNTNGNGSICYQNALNFTLEMCEKHKPETRVSERHKPGFRVWQNERVSPGPGFSKTRVSIPTADKTMRTANPVRYFANRTRVTSRPIQSNPIQCDVTGAGSPLCPHLK